MYGQSPDSELETTPKRPKISQTLREHRIKELNEEISDVTDIINLKEKRRNQAEGIRNYKVCEQLSEEIMELKTKKRS